MVKVETAVLEDPSGGWLVDTGYANGQYDETCDRYSKRGASDYAKLIRRIARLTDSEEIVSLVASNTISHKTAHGILKGLKIHSE